MNEKALQTLEFNKIKESLVEKAGSAPGKDLCKALVPLDDITEIERLQEETEDALERIIRAGAPSFAGCRDLSASYSRLKVQAALTSGELLRIVSLLECSRRLSSYGSSTGKKNTGDGRDSAVSSPGSSEDTKDSSRGRILDRYFEMLSPLISLANEIRRCIPEEDVIADDASPKLKKLRKEQAVVNGRIHSQLTSMVNGSLRTYLQDAVITMRGDRYCLPVKAEYKGQVPGMIHDQSSTGSTYFIEPQAVVAMNNQLRELALQEQAEIAEILKDLSLMAGEHTEELADNQKALTQLDFIFARGALALAHNGSRPVYNTERRVRIRRGRHPLIDKKAVVPIDIHIGDDYDLLIITGPNTGGKTVALKTLGLFVLMGQAGLHIPAGDRSELSVFPDVYADIGDEQSIEQSLSTFSSHMTNTVTILKQAAYDSLCLFDELGAGTDPTEGAALAIAILDHLHKRGIRTMATTHYSELKVYALTTEGVENACCEFDVETLRPTYRLLIGIPGKSNAFAISSRLGLPKEIIDSAREQISEENESFEDLLTRLENDRVTMENDRLEIERYKGEIEALKGKIQQRQDRIEASREKILHKANEEAARILQEAKDVADETIRTFQKAGPGASMKDLEKARANVGGKLKEKKAKSAQQKPQASGTAVDPDKLKKGDSVKIVSMGLKGIVIGLPDKKGNVTVQCGIINSKVHYKDLVMIAEEDISSLLKKSGFASSASKSGAGGKGGGSIGMSKSFSVSTEINLLGKRVDEALNELDKYLDDAYLAHLPSVRIVHGKGTGALRKAVHDHLRRTRTVAEYRLGEFGEGDSGVTIAVFK